MKVSEKKDCINIQVNNQSVVITKKELRVLNILANACFFHKLRTSKFQLEAFFLTKFYCFDIEYARLFL